MSKKRLMNSSAARALALSAFLLAGAGSRNDALANNVSFSENDSWVNHASKDVHVGSINLNNGEWESDGTKIIRSAGLRWKEIKIFFVKSGRNHLIILLTSIRIMMARLALLLRKKI